MWKQNTKPSIFSRLVDNFLICFHVYRHRGPLGTVQECTWRRHADTRDASSPPGAWPVLVRHGERAHAGGLGLYSVLLWNTEAGKVTAIMIRRQGTLYECFNLSGSILSTLHAFSTNWWALPISEIKCSRRNRICSHKNCIVILFHTSSPPLAGDLQEGRVSCLTHQCVPKGLALYHKTRHLSEVCRMKKGHHCSMKHKSREIA